MSNGNFSKQPDDVLADALSKGYAGVRFEQGAPVLDRDLNLMGDLLAETTRRALSLFVGDGLAERPSGFSISSDGLDNDLWISPGSCLLGGLLAVNPAPVRYTKQPGAKALTVPAPGDAIPGLQLRIDLVYLVAKQGEETADPALLNEDDVGVRTSVRQKVDWSVRVHEGLTTADAQHAMEDDGGEQRTLKWMATPISVERLSSIPSLGPETATGGIRVPLALLLRAPGTTQIDEIEDVRPEPLAVRSVARRVTKLERTINGVMGARVNDLPALYTRVSDLESLNLGDRVTALEQKIGVIESALDKAFTQTGWRHCTKCMIVYYEGDGAISICPKGGTHNPDLMSYVLRHTVPVQGAQASWRCCFKCRSLFYHTHYDASSDSAPANFLANNGCPANQRRLELNAKFPEALFDPRDTTGLLYSICHEGTASLELMIPIVEHNEQAEDMYGGTYHCSRCHCLFVAKAVHTGVSEFDILMGSCPVDPTKSHNKAGSGLYALTRE